MYLLYTLNCAERYLTANLLVIVTEAALRRIRLDSLPACFQSSEDIVNIQNKILAEVSQEAFQGEGRSSGCGTATRGVFGGNVVDFGVKFPITAVTFKKTKPKRVL